MIMDRLLFSPYGTKYSKTGPCKICVRPPLKNLKDMVRPYPDVRTFPTQLLFPKSEYINEIVNNCKQ